MDTKRKRSVLGSSLFVFGNVKKSSHSRLQYCQHRSSGGMLRTYSVFLATSTSWLACQIRRLNHRRVVPALCVSPPAGFCVSPPAERHQDMVSPYPPAVPRGHGSSSMAVLKGRVRRHVTYVLCLLRCGPLLAAMRASACAAAWNPISSNLFHTWSRI